MAKVINTVIKLRKDKEVNYQKVENSFIPANGEVCLVDTEEYGLRVKVGNGVDNFKTLSYQDNSNNVVLNGYFLNNKFYTDSTYTKELEQGINHLYIDKNSKIRYNHICHYNRRLRTMSGPEGSSIKKYRLCVMVFIFRGKKDE